MILVFLGFFFLIIKANEKMMEIENVKLACLQPPWPEHSNCGLDSNWCAMRERCHRWHKPLRKSLIAQGNFS